jgi:hypothetical protein
MATGAEGHQNRSRQRVGHALTPEPHDVALV